MKETLEGEEREALVEQWLPFDLQTLHFHPEIFWAPRGQWGGRGSEDFRFGHFRAFGGQGRGESQWGIIWSKKFSNNLIIS